MEMIYKLMVDDKPGVLDRTVGLVRRHAKNISFLLVFNVGGGQSLLIFKLVDGIVDDAISARIIELDDVRSLETVEDDITERVTALVGVEEC